MPAFGKTHQDEALWSIIAFVRQLPHLQGKDYDAMVKAAGLQEEPRCNQVSAYGWVLSTTNTKAY
ncbi:MAG: hypothetical protein ACREJU_05680 [Nitrospiraceae bacterium]